MYQGHCRRVADRRNQPQPLHLHGVFGRRKLGRRASDTAGLNPALDHYPFLLLLCVLSILLLCVLDAFHTTQLLSLGARELNPLMDILVRHDHRWFVLTKVALTGLCLIVLVAYRHARWFGLRTRTLLGLILAVYSLLIAYQFALFPADYPYTLHPFAD
ncbi:MAG: DUF5658 family protein [Pseudomonadota bacterium]